MDLRQVFLKNIAQTSDSPLALELVKSEGVYLYDKQGKAYIDLISGIAVSNIGHRHPMVVAAIKKQVDDYLHQMVYGEYLQSPQIQLATALIETVSVYDTPRGEKIDNVYFTSSGTEAVEGALKLAKRFTGRYEIVACNKAYHGSTHGALSLGDEEFKRNYRPLLPGIQKIERNRLEDLEKITNETAAVIIEPIGGEIGVVLADQKYIIALADKCAEVGALLIFDEIQSGFGRSGRFWAFEHFCVAPDILLSAKGLGGGMPIGAFMASTEVMNVFKDNPILGHITTFGGHPVSCAAGLATLHVIHDEINHTETLRKGDLFRLLLKHPKIKEVRGIGLMLAAQMDNFDQMKRVIDRTIENGIITDWFLYCDNAMRIAPPLIITDEQIHKACGIILDALNEE